LTRNPGMRAGSVTRSNPASGFRERLAEFLWMICVFLSASCRQPPFLQGVKDDAPIGQKLDLCLQTASFRESLGSPERNDLMPIRHVFQAARFFGEMAELRAIEFCKRLARDGYEYRMERPAIAAISE
jgi:hypothetical protein